MTSDIKWMVQNGAMDDLKEATFDVNETITGRTLLHIAADYGQIDVIKYLVEAKKGDVNAEDKHGISVLLAAIWESEGSARHKQCIEYLLEKGAKKTGKAPDGTPYVDCAEDPAIKQLLQ